MIFPGLAENLLAEHYFHDPAALLALAAAVPCSLEVRCECPCAPD